MNLCIFQFLLIKLFISVLSEFEKLVKLLCDLDVTVQQINDLRTLLQMTKSGIPIEEPHVTKVIDLDATARLDSSSSSSSPVGLSDLFDANEYLTDVAVSDLSSDGTETEMEGDKKPKKEIAVSEAKP